MPIVPNALLSSVFYLYRTKADANAGIHAGGTGFFVAIPTEDQLGHHYGVTNWHVAVRDGFSSIRINTTTGTEVLEFDPSDWIFDPQKDDIAIIPLNIRRASQVAMFIGTQLMVTPESVARERIGPGDDVFMIGQFVDLDMKQTNVPTLRFGNISTPPVQIPQPTKYKTGLSYCVDMHSRSGYSGSPVFVYRTPGNTLEWTVAPAPFINVGSGLFALLGIHWGHFSEELPIRRIKKKAPQGTAWKSKKLYDEYIEGMSGMTCVVPAWRIADLLNHDTLKEQRIKELSSRPKNVGA